MGCGALGLRSELEGPRGVCVQGIRGPWVPPSSPCPSHSQGGLGFLLALLWRPGPLPFNPWMGPKYTRCTNVNLLILLKILLILCFSCSCFLNKCYLGERMVSTPRASSLRGSSNLVLSPGGPSQLHQGLVLSTSQIFRCYFTKL